jgi:hypothetical protein
MIVNIKFSGFQRRPGWHKRIHLASQGWASPGPPRIGDRWGLVATKPGYLRTFFCANPKAYLFGKSIRPRTGIVMSGSASRSVLRRRLSMNSPTASEL